MLTLKPSASCETSEIIGAMPRNGFFRQMAHHSTTSQYGTLSRGPEFVTDDMRDKAHELFMRDIRNGAFVKEWSDEQAAGSKTLGALLEAVLLHGMSQAEFGVIQAVQGAHALDAEGD